MPRVRYVGGLLLAAFLALSSCGRELPECVVEFAVYDRVGKSIENWRVTRISIQASDLHRQGPDTIMYPSPADLPEEYRPVVVNEKIYFHEGWPGWLPWLVKLEDAAGESVEKEIDIRGCLQQRESIVFDVDLPAGDEATDWLERKGSLKGCVLDQHWWVRSSPLFAVPPRPDPDVYSTFDAYVEPSTGEFSIRTRHGVRHLIVVGYGSEPLKAFAVNVDAGSTGADLGEFDLSDSCLTANL